MKRVFDVIAGHDKKVCLVFLGGDEPMAREVAIATREKYDFGALFFKGPGRYFEQNNGDYSFRLDPNQIWTDGAIESADGQRISPMSDWGTFVKVQQELFTPAWEFLAGHNALIALHNNGKSPDSFSSYLRELVDQVPDAWAGDSENDGDFIVVTRREDFESLKKRGSLNIVLLGAFFNDRSLSCWSVKKNKRYFNIGTKAGPRLAETAQKQQKMLDTVLSIF